MSLKCKMLFNVLLLFTFIFIGCEESNNLTNSGDTKNTTYDNLRFTGYYYYEGSNDSLDLSITIGDNGELTSLVAEEVGSMNISDLNFSGNISSNGLLNISGQASDDQVSVNITYSGLFETENGFSTGTGTWSGTYTEGNLVDSFGGTWDLIQDTFDLYENDNIKENVPLMGTDSITLHRYLTVNDTDWIKFNAVESKVYEITVSGDVTPYLHLTDDFYRPFTYAKEIEGYPRTIRWSCSQSGTYYVHMADLSGRAGRYLVTVNELNQSTSDNSIYVAWETNNFNMIHINGKTGFVTRFPNSSFDFYTDIEYGPDGTLYGIGDELTIVDPETGVAELVGGLRVDPDSSNVLMSNAYFSPSGELYTLENGNDYTVYKVNLSNGLLTTVVDSNGIYGDKLFYNGKLYSGPHTLQIIDTNTYKIESEIGRLSDWVDNIFEKEDGTVIGMSTIPDELFTIDMSTAEISNKLLIGATSVCCITEKQSRQILNRKRTGVKHSRPIEVLRKLKEQYEKENYRR